MLSRYPGVKVMGYIAFWNQVKATGDKVHRVKKHSHIDNAYASHAKKHLEKVRERNEIFLFGSCENVAARLRLMNNHVAFGLNVYRQEHIDNVVSLVGLSGDQEKYSFSNSELVIKGISLSLRSFLYLHLQDSETKYPFPLFAHHDLKRRNL